MHHGLGLAAAYRRHHTLNSGKRRAVAGDKSTVLAAASPQSRLNWTAFDIQPSASSRVYNERQAFITVHYRFYWYDAGWRWSAGVPRSNHTRAFVGTRILAVSRYLGRIRSGLSLFVRRNGDAPHVTPLPLRWRYFSA